VLVIYTNADTRGIGRQRLLHELLGQAIRDGHVPCVVRAEGDQDPLVQFPRNATQFALRLLKAINGARAVCQT